MKSLIWLGGTLALVLIVGGWFWGSYNGLVTKSASVDNAWSQVETQYQRRFDLIPNLVASTKGFLGQEQKIFGDIAEARTHYAGSAAGTNDRVNATAQYEGALSRLLVIMENYPVLQSNQTVKGLMDELAGTENRVLVARDRYNGEVQGYNVMVKRFPKNLIAGMFGFEARAFFKADEAAKTAPKVDLQ